MCCAPRGRRRVQAGSAARSSSVFGSAGSIGQRRCSARRAKRSLAAQGTVSTTSPHSRKNHPRSGAVACTGARSKRRRVPASHRSHARRDVAADDGELAQVDAARVANAARGATPRSPHPRCDAAAGARRIAAPLRLSRRAPSARRRHVASRATDGVQRTTQLGQQVGGQARGPRRRRRRAAPSGQGGPREGRRAGGRAASSRRGRVPRAGRRREARRGRDELRSREPEARRAAVGAAAGFAAGRVIKALAARDAARGRAAAERPIAAERRGPAPYGTPWPPPSSTLDWEGQTVLDRDGAKVGKIEEIFLVEETGRARVGASSRSAVDAHDARPADARAIALGQRHQRARTTQRRSSRGSRASRPTPSPSRAAGQRAVPPLRASTGRSARAGCGGANGTGNGRCPRRKARRRHPPPRRRVATAGTAAASRLPRRPRRCSDVAQLQRPA